MFAAVCFDLDGTLIDSESLTAEAMARVFWRDQGVALDEADRAQIVGHSWAAIDVHLRAKHPALTWSRAQMIAATAAERERVFAEANLAGIPGAAAAVARCAGLKRALVTGSSRVEAIQALRLLDLVAAFDAVVTADDVATSKPSPEGYLKALHEMRIKPSAAIVVEDSEPGIAAGRAAGCFVVAVRAGAHPSHRHDAAHIQLTSLDDLTPEALRQWAGQWTI
ncbi:MAG: HAD family phosphatase [Myxococcales bacterium]|nr:HAD family phosphatase [Myxococcales bacterium]